MDRNEKEGGARERLTRDSTDVGKAWEQDDAVGCAFLLAHHLSHTVVVMWLSLAPGLGREKHCRKHALLDLKNLPGELKATCGSERCRKRGIGEERMRDGAGCDLFSDGDTAKA